MNERQRKFADAYARCGNGTRAAIEAGYAPNSAHSQASRLIRDPKVQEFIGAKKINRGVHAEQTYQNQITLAAIALEEVKKARDGADYQRLHSAIRAADKVQETLAKMEGLLLPQAMQSAEKIENHTHITVSREDVEAKLGRRISILQRAGLDPASGNGHS